MVNTCEPHSILVIDDTPVNLLVVEILFKKFWPECVIHKAESGAHALQASHNNAFTFFFFFCKSALCGWIDRQCQSTRLRRFLQSGLVWFAVKALQSRSIDWLDSPVSEQPC